MFRQIIIVSMIVFNFPILLSADVDEGKELFLDHKECLECHNYEDFKHREKKVNSFKKLHNQVNQCSFSSDTGWFDDEVTSVAEYLNHYFYKYKDTKK